MDEEKKNKVSKVFTDCWNLAKKYCFAPIDEKGWEQFAGDGEQISEKYKSEEDTAAYYLCRHIITDLIMYAQEEQQKRKDNEKDPKKL